jgi:hypothetical protein
MSNEVGPCQERFCRHECVSSAALDSPGWLSCSLRSNQIARSRVRSSLWKNGVRRKDFDLLGK